MTFSAMVTPHDTDSIRVTFTSGPVSVVADEHSAHLRYFWGQLGHLLDDERPGGKSHGQHAYEAYSRHVGGVSVDGHELPAWDDQLGGIKSAWEVAAAAVRQSSGMHVAIPAKAEPEHHHAATTGTHPHPGTVNPSGEAAGVTF
jgi:hypothetical protein